jgi:hypothetical protein
MSVYVGIDVHRKRSQVAVVTEDGTVQLNKNTVNGTAPILRLIGDLPSGTPVAFEAAFGWSWLARLLEDYGFEAHLRWVLNQAAQTAERSPEFSATYQTIASKRGKKIATIAISRKLLTRAWHLLAAAQAADPAAPGGSAATAHPQTGRVTQPRASSLTRHEQADGRARSSD